MRKMQFHSNVPRQENDRLHMELDRCQNLPPPPSYGLRDRSRSPEPGYASRSVHVEVAELKDKLEQTSNELRRTQAELRLNQGDYERSHVELEQMQEKVSGIERGKAGLKHYGESLKAGMWDL